MIAKGGSSASKIYLGSTEVSKIYKGDTLVYGGGGSEVDGHQISEVRMPLGSYLDTGYYPNNNTRVELGFTPLSKNNWSAIFIGRTSSNTEQFSLQYRDNVSTVRAYCGTNISQSICDKSVDFRPETSYTVEMSDAALVVDGTSYSMNVGQTFTSSVTLTINGSSEGTVNSENVFTYFKVYDNGTLVRDYVPWIRENNTVGMLDKVNDVFYASATSVAFTDNTISLPSGYTRLNYITATGVQRFNCDFTPTYQTNYLVKCRFTGSNSFKSILSSRTSSSKNRFELMAGNETTPNSDVYFGYNNGAASNTITNFTDLDMVFVKAENRLYCYRDGTFNYTNTRTRASFTSPKNLTIGCSNTNGSYANWFVGDIMELDFFGNAHYIPCISPNNKVGMYDIINGVFKSSETGTEFVAGTVYGS